MAEDIIRNEFETAYADLGIEDKDVEDLDVHANYLLLFLYSSLLSLRFLA
jgi:hypothetical protein